MGSETWGMLAWRRGKLCVLEAWRVVAFGVGAKCGLRDVQKDVQKDVRSKVARSVALGVDGADLRAAVLSARGELLEELEVEEEGVVRKVIVHRVV